MKTKFRVSFLLVSMLLLMATVGTLVVSAAETHVDMVVDPVTVDVGDTVIVVISNEEVTAESFGVVLNFDTQLLECTEILGVDDDEYLGIYYSGKKGAATWADAQVADTVVDTNKDGKFSFGWMTTKDTVVFEGKVATLKFKAIDAGTAQFSLTEKTTGADAFTGVVTNATVTIMGNEPTCEHATTKAVSNNNGTHNVVCADDTCGAIVEENVACSGGTATCTEQAVCATCEAAYGSVDATNHGGNIGPVNCKTNNDGTHNFYNWCDACRQVVGTEPAQSNVPCVDSNGDKECDYCEAVIPCKHTETKAVSNNDGTHNVVCTNEACNGYVVTPNETCDFTNNHTCVCGQVEKFTLSVYVSATEKTVELTVPYGANILDVLTQAESNAKIPTLGTEIRVKNDGFNGMRIPNGYSYQGEDEHMIGVPTDLTMPGEKLEVNQDCFDDGWYISDLDDDGVHESYEFIRYDVESYGYLTEGWHYIEENYDDVQGGAWYYFYEGTGEYENWFFRAEGLTRVPYPTVSIEGVEYKANAEDLAGDAKYNYSDADSAVFYFDEETGAFRYDYTGIVDDNGITRYAVKGCIEWHVGMVKIGTDYYYFAGDMSVAKRGNAMMKGYVYATRDCGTGFAVGDKKMYFFDRDTGKMELRNGILDIDNIAHYHENGALAIGVGVVTGNDGDGDYYIYVKSNGQLATGKYWPTNNVEGSGLEYGKYYNFGTDGKYRPVIAD